jgi:hypothetical protein
MKKATRKKRKKSSKILTMNRYAFENIFNVYPDLGIIIPRFNVVINNTIASQGQAINKNTTFNGLNLFDYIGRDFAGTWDPRTRYLTISGFY